MVLFKTPAVIKNVFKQLVWDLPGNENVLYLTFDDGPTPGITEQILDILDQYNAKATFFCIGRNMERHPRLGETILKRGHETGNHTYSHLKGWYTKNSEYFNDIDLASHYVPARLFRPAYGMITPAQARYLRKQYRIIMWDIMSYDFHPGVSREECLEKVIRYSHPGSVIVFHDSLKAAPTSLYALPALLSYYSSKNFKFKSIPLF